MRGEGDCPVGRGYVHRLSPKLAIRVSKVNIDKGDWWIRYVIEDRRHKARSLKRTPNEHIDYSKVRDLHSAENFKWDQLPEGSSGKDLAKISEESNYMGSAAGVIDDAGEGVEAELLEKWAKKADPTGEALREVHRSLMPHLDRIKSNPRASSRQRKHVKEIEHHLAQDDRTH